MVPAAVLEAGRDVADAPLDGVGHDAAMLLDVPADAALEGADGYDLVHWLRRANLSPNSSMAAIIVRDSIDTPQ